MITVIPSTHLTLRDDPRGVPREHAILSSIWSSHYIYARNVNLSVPRGVLILYVVCL